MTKEKIITNVLKEQKIINYQTYFANAMSVAMGIYADQETAALRAENERLREEVVDFLNTIPVDNGNAYLAGFDEHLEKLKQALNNL